MQTRRNFLRSSGQLSLFGLIAAGAPALIPHNEPIDELGSDDDISLKNEQDRLQSEQPNLILIGDSMLPCRVNPQQLTTTLNRKVSLLYRNGSATAAWFLMFKNIVCSLPNPPSHVAFFFRDHYFHIPRLRIDGDRATLIRSLSIGRELEFESVITGSQAAKRPIIDHTSRLLDHSYAIDGYSNEAHNRLRKLAFNLTSFGTDGKSRREHMDRIFSINNLRHDLNDDLNDLDGTGTDDINDNAAFSTNPSTSFLPHLDSLAKNNNIQLIFHRVRRRRHTRPGYRDDPALAKYINAFRQWTADHNHLFTDESGDTSLGAGLFADGDHVAQEATTLWTRHFSLLLNAVIPPLPLTSKNSD